MAKSKLVYPLEQVLEIKVRRVEEAERVVKEKQRLLEKEEKKLQEYEEALRQVDEHHSNKLQQLRDGLDEGIQPHEIDQMKKYLKEVKVKRYEEQRKVDRQKKQVETAKKNLEAAQQTLKEKRLEVDKLEMHKAHWKEEQLKEMRKQEAKLQDEVGSLVFLSTKKRERDAELKKKKRSK